MRALFDSHLAQSTFPPLAAHLFASKRLVIGNELYTHVSRAVAPVGAETDDVFFSLAYMYIALSLTQTKHAVTSTLPLTY